MAVVSYPLALAIINFTGFEFALEDAASSGDQLSLAMWFVTWDLADVDPGLVD